MLGKNKETRLIETLDYVSKFVSATYKTTLERQITNRSEASSRISLGFRGFGINNPTETKRRHALRALLLSLMAFGYSNQLNDAKQHYKNAREADILDAVKSFSTITGANENSVIEAAKRVKLPLGGMDFKKIYKYRRGSLGPTLGGGNCYAGVAQWLYLGGMVSLRWLAKHGEMNVGLGAPAEPKNIFTWSGKVTTENLAEAIVKGKIVYFSRFVGAGGTTVHYALSSGGGKCIGINNPTEVSERWHPNFTADKMAASVWCEFSIAGYLASCQRMYTEVPRDRDNYVFVKYAPCKPTQIL